MKLFFPDAVENKFKDIDYSYHKTADGDHGRVEVRRYWTVSDTDWLSQKPDWEGLRTIGMVESERHVDDQVSVEKRFFIASIDNDLKLMVS